MKEIKVLGTGCCSKCQNLYDAVKRKVEELKLGVSVTKSTDIMEIMKYGVISTPAIVIDEKVVAFGSVPSPEQIEKILNDNK
ncbi:MAG: thioredoxin family protein [Endomicrobiaceae bacterium]|nr:thioredoxin family protein [Endomicrobiaceae bacterium]